MSKKKINHTEKTVLNESDPRVVRYVDHVGNKAEEVIFDTIIEESLHTRTWIRRTKNKFKEEVKYKGEIMHYRFDPTNEKSPKVLSFNEAKELWERYLP